MSFIDQQWTRVLPAKVIGGTLCAFGGPVSYTHLDVYKRQACGEFSVEQVELRAQGIWCCVYGLLERILIEQPVPAYRDKVIEEVLDLIMASLRPHETA